MATHGIVLTGNHWINRKNLLFTFYIASTAILINTGQDFLHAYLNHYAFYLSESLLFQTYWITLFSVTICQVCIIQYLVKKQISPAHWYSIASVFAAALLHCLVYPLFIFAGSYLLLDHTYHFLNVLKECVSEDLYKILLIYGLVALTKFKRRQILPESVGSSVIPQSSYLSTITVNTGRNFIILKTDDILYLNSSSPYVCIHTKDNKFLNDITLKAVSEKLDPRQFVRVHKSAIVNIKKISSYRSRQNGDYDIILYNGETVRMSRNYRESFRKHTGLSSS